MTVPDADYQRARQALLDRLRATQVDGIAAVDERELTHIEGYAVAVGTSVSEDGTRTNPIVLMFLAGFPAAPAASGRRGRRRHRAAEVMPEGVVFQFVLTTTDAVRLGDALIRGADQADTT